MTDDELKKLTLASAARMIARKEISPVELTEAALARIDRLNPDICAFITVMSDQALDRARDAERKIASGYTSPLQGVPVSVKDLYDINGIRTTAGAKVFAGDTPQQDATAVKKLKDAGAVIIGKTNLHEFAFGVTTVNPYYGTARNPWDRDRISGGSSGGSASAVALGMGVGSLGSDTGGSIRIPASLCGIVGMKPTYGRVSLHGVVPLAWSMDHAGPMTKTVEDSAILLGVISGHDPKDANTRNVEVPRFAEALTGNIKGVRAGIPKEYFYERLDPEVNNAVRTALRNLERLGAELTDVDLPAARVNRAVWTQIASPEAYSYHEHLLRKHADSYGSHVRARIEAGQFLLSIDYVRAQRARALMKQQCKAAFEHVDVIVTPTVPIQAPRIDQIQDPWGGGPEPAVTSLPRFTRFFNIVGLPTISIPCGFTSEGLPIGVQIAGKAFDESTVLRVAHAYEQDARWFERRPEI